MLANSDNTQTTQIQDFRDLHVKVETNGAKHGDREEDEFLLTLSIKKDQCAGCEALFALPTRCFLIYNRN